MSRIHHGWQRNAAFTRGLIVAVVLSLGVGDARAETATATPRTPAAQAPNRSKAAPKKDSARKAPATRGEGKAAQAATSGAPSAAYLPIEKPDGSLIFPMRRTQMSDRMNAGIRRWEAEQARKQKPASATEPSGGTGLRSALTSVMRLALAQTAGPTWADLPKPVDYYNVPNYAYSKLPIASCSVSAQACTKDADCPGYKPPIVVGVNIYPGGETCTGPVQSGGIKKFKDSLAPLCGQGLGTSTLNSQCIPIATPDTTSFADADYYELGLKDFTTWWFHSDLGVPTRLRGYYQKNTTGAAANNAYLGPVIIAQTNRAVRVKLVNELPAGAGGDLFVPTDTVVEGAGEGPNGAKYTNNRAAIHLHGGNTPWISDGTQHQWTAPINQTSTFPAPFTGQDLKGWSAENVPDMWYDATGTPIPSCNLQQTCGVQGATNNPGAGMLTYYWTNQQSGRLMFYHDHAYGITRLNVIAGEAAGYLLVNPPDEDALAAASVPGTIGSNFFGRTPAATDPAATAPDLTHMIPLVIQDRTFVPPVAQMIEQDPSWDPAKWGQEGSIWYPHVYTPNQWPDNPDGSGTGPFGHWDYGPWFWPAQNQLTEVDGAGVAVNRPLTQPCLTMYPNPAHLDPATGAQLPWTTLCPSTPHPSAIPESFLDTPVLNGIAYPTLTVEPAAYRFQILNAAQERNWNLSWFVADANGTEVAMVAAVPHSPLGATAVSTTPPLCDPNAPLSTATGLPFGPDLAGVPACWPSTWPTDSRQGGVPDPAAAGPKWIQIGSEAGILPAPAVIPPTPVGYEQNKRNIVVLNVSTKGLFMGPAERADVVVDFTQWAGKTLILYNDAPAPVPAGDTRLDPYTGAPDQTLSGGAPTTLPGYGPNVRTIMQVKVAPARSAASASQPVLDEGLVATTLGQRFKASQPAPIVPEAAYTTLYGNGSTFTNTYLPIQLVTSLTFTPVGETQGITVPIQNKTIQELFTLNYGRMNSLLGVEIPTTNFQNQTTIPFDNYDPATDFFSDGEIQVWKVTHNGVDTHTIHFHLVNVQVINRVGWDGQVRPPDANELGWKESVRMNPLEDIYIALKPVKQNLPWPLPDKWRPMDVTRPLGTSAQFTQLDVFNQPITYQNQMANYGWEYVWHCHLLGHEEEDMLRAEVFVVAPETPTGLMVIQSGSNAQLSWTEQAKSTMQFTVQVSNDATFPATGTTSFVAYPPADQLANHLTVPGTVITTTDTQTTLDPTKSFFYRVRAEKVLTSPAMTLSPGGAGAALQQFTAKSAWSNVASLGNIASVTLVSPVSGALDFGSQLVKTTSAPQTVTLGITGGGIGIVPSFTGTNPGDFAVASNGCAAAAANCNITVTFTPAASGARSATLVLTPTVGAAITVALTGTGTSPAASVTPTSLAFGDQILKTSSAPRSFQLNNGGTAPLTVSGIVVAGVDPTQFVITANTCIVAGATTGTVAANGGSCTVTVAFAPTSTGTKNARVEITSNDPTNPILNVTLSGNGTAPVAVVSPLSLAFTSDLNVASAPQTVTVTNSGTAPLIVNGVAIGGAYATDYALVSNGCTAATVAVGSSCTFGVTFTPPSGLNQPRTATITVSTSDPVTPTAVVSVSGLVLVPSPAVTPTSLTFPTTTVATTSGAQNVVLSNGGPAGAALLISSIGVSGDFAISANACSTTLAGGSSCTISVTFTPTTSGTRTGTLTITSSNATTLTVNLTGTGSVVSLSPTTLAFGDQPVGTTSTTRNVTIVNAGTTALTVNAPSITGPNAADYAVTNNCGTTLNAGRSCTLSVRFTPHAAGASSATLSVPTSDPFTPTVALTGNGTAPAATVSPNALTFSSAINLATAAQPVTLTNTGTAALTINGVSIGGTDATQFTQTNNCTATLAVGGSCTINVVFSPTSAATLTKSASLNVSVAAPAASPSVALSGTILVPTYTLTGPSGALPNGSTLNFGKVTVGTTSPAQTVTVTNGAVQLGIRGISVGGNNANNFLLTNNNCPAVLPANGTCSFDVSFRPNRTGNRSANVTIRVQAPGTSTTINLIGSGG